MRNTCDDGSDEPGAEVYAAATKRDQARITHEESKAQVRGLLRDDPRLRRHIVVSRDIGRTPV